MNRSAGFFTAVVLLWTINGHCEVYKWTDEEGRVHYGDTPEENAPAQTLELQPAPDTYSTDLDNLYQRAREADQRMDARRQQAVDKRVARQEDADRKQRCMEARKRLSMLQEQRPVYHDASGELRVKWDYDFYQGERAYLDDAQRQAETGRARAAVAAECENPNDAEEQKLARDAWIRADRCSASKADLENRLDPARRTSPQEISNRRKLVERYCGD